MSLAYTLDCEPDEEKIRKLCRETECTVVKKRDTDEYYFALTGGGMDYSQDVVMGYIIAQGRVPPERNIFRLTPFLFTGVWRKEFPRSR